MEQTCQRGVNEECRSKLLHRDYRLLMTIPHADFAYDMDDPSPKKVVFVYFAAS